MKIRVSLNKFLLATIGSIFPCKRHPFGKLGNILRVHFARQICQKVGKNCLIEKGASFNEGVVLEDFAAVGVNCFIDSFVTISGPNMMGPNVKIYTRNHLYNEEKHIFENFTESKPIHVGAHSWIGTQVLVLPGASIGSHTIVGAGSVVTKSIPDGVVAAGNPYSIKKVLDKKYYKP